MTPLVKECDPIISEPDPEIRSEGINCQKLNSAAGNKIKYQDVQKKLLVSPVFDTLKVNSELAQLTKKSFAQTLLAKSDALTGTVVHGLLVQRQRLSTVVKSLVAKHLHIAEDTAEAFLKESPVKTISDDLLH